MFRIPTTLWAVDFRQQPFVMSITCHLQQFLPLKQPAISEFNDVSTVLILVVLLVDCAERRWGLQS